MTPPVIAKVGGSLFDLPDLRQRLMDWISSLGDSPIILVPGGGHGADVIRHFDQTHRLGEESAHWLALKVLTVNAEFLARLLGVPVVSAAVCAGHRVNILDAYEFCRAEEHTPAAVEHSWRVTSDSIAAHAAARSRGELVLLKSTDLPFGITWTEAAHDGLVDEAFPEIVSRNGIQVSWINLREFTCIPRK
jgi:5-(aminomethyl)-3-furanmethanol phosphate kinase